MQTPLIALDARAVRPGMTGVGRLVGHLLRAAALRDTGFRWGLFTDVPEFLEGWLVGDSPPGRGPRQLPSHVALWSVPVSPESHPRTDWWLNVTLPRELRRRGAALFHGPAYAVPWRRLPIPTVLSVHDMAHRLRPPTHPWQFRCWLRWSIGRGVRVADRTVVLSEAVARDLTDVHPRVSSRVVVIPGGVAPEVRAPSVEAIAAFREARSLPERCLLHVGTFEPRKNHRFLLEIHGALCAEMDDTPALIMAGAPGPALGAVERWASRSPWRDRILIRSGATGFSDSDLVALMSGAEALLFPSVSEGFGLPVLEALACGTPVFASDAPGLDVFSGSPATLLPLGEVQPWVGAIRRLLGDPTAREEARRCGPAWARRHSWGSAADRLLDLYRALLRG